MSTFEMDSLRKLIRMGGLELAQELVERFVNESPRRLEEARAALASGELKPVEQICHRICSDAGWLGARAMQELASEAEMLAADRKAESLPASLARLQALGEPLWRDLEPVLKVLKEGGDPCASG